MYLSTLTHINSFFFSYNFVSSIPPPLLDCQLCFLICILKNICYGLYKILLIRHDTFSWQFYNFPRNCGGSCPSLSSAVATSLFILYLTFFQSLSSLRDRGLSHARACKQRSLLSGRTHQKCICVICSIFCLL